VVFANAGVTTLTPLGKMTEGDYGTIFHINVKGLLFTVQKALPLLADGVKAYELLRNLPSTAVGDHCDLKVLC